MFRNMQAVILDGLMCRGTSLSYLRCTQTWLPEPPYELAEQPWLLLQPGWLPPLCRPPAPD
jgi:hypothetical protein